MKTTAMKYLLILIFLTSIIDITVAKPEEGAHNDIPMEILSPAETVSQFLKFEDTTSIDYSNRICPEYFGINEAGYPEGVRRACIIESDILCPSETYQRCEPSFQKCNTRNKTTSRTPPDPPLRSQEWQSYILEGRTHIPYRFRFQEYTDMDNFITEDVKNWVISIENAMRAIQRYACIQFFPADTNWRDFNTMRKPSSPWSNKRILEIQETDCLCGVNRLGQKIERHRDREEQDNTIIFYPTWRKGRQSPLATFYKTTDIRHVGTKVSPLDEMKITCSYFNATIFHLLFHALGIGHANNRPDRDNYVYVNEENILDDYKQFFKTTNFNLTHFNKYRRLRYAHSIMFMDPMAWSRFEPLATFSPTDTFVNPLYWQRHMTLNDLDRLALIYGKPYFYEGNPYYCGETATPISIPIKPANKPAKCVKIEETASTRRIGHNKDIDVRHIGGVVQFECINKTFIMFGDGSRTCMPSGLWTGEQPFCVSPQDALWWCTQKRNFTLCPHTTSRSIKSAKDMDGVEEIHEYDYDYASSAGQAEKLSAATESYKYEGVFKTNETISITGEICVRIIYSSEPHTLFKVLLVQNGGSKLVFRHLSSVEDWKRNVVNFETSVEKGKPFALKVIGRYNNSKKAIKVYYVHIITRKCNDL